MYVHTHIRLQYPSPFTNMLGFMGVFSFDFLALECMSSGKKKYFGTVYLWCILPIVLSLMLVVVGLFRTMVPQSAESRRTIRNQHIWLLLFLSYMVLPSVSSKQLQSLDCVPINGESFVRSETSIDCASSEYLDFRAVVIMFILLYQLIPIIWMVSLFRNRHVLNAASGDVARALYIREHNPNLHHLRFLFNDYKCDRWWFEIADMYRRIAFIGLLPLASTKSSTRASLGCVLAVFSVILFRELNPYKAIFANAIAYLAQVYVMLFLSPLSFPRALCFCFEDMKSS
jgi:hypothetical protein